MYALLIRVSGLSLWCRLHAREIHARVKKLPIFLKFLDNILRSYHKLSQEDLSNKLSTLNRSTDDCKSFCLNILEGKAIASARNHQYIELAQLCLIYSSNIT